MELKQFKSILLFYIFFISIILQNILEPNKKDLMLVTAKGLLKFLYYLFYCGFLSITGISPVSLSTFLSISSITVLSLVITSFIFE